MKRGGEVAFKRENGKTVVPVDYATNDGRLFLFLKNRIAEVAVECPENVRRGESVCVTFRALDAGGHPVEALLPDEIRLFDAAGRELDGAGWVCLEGGVASVEIQTNLDDADGDYRLVCKDRASGLEASRTIALVP